jgi:hypothetical protein
MASLDTAIVARNNKRLSRQLFPLIVDCHDASRRAWTTIFAEAGFAPHAAEETYDIVSHTVCGVVLSSISKRT